MVPRRLKALLRLALCACLLSSIPSARAQNPAVTINVDAAASRRLLEHRPQ